MDLEIEKRVFRTGLRAARYVVAAGVFVGVAVAVLGALAYGGLYALERYREREWLATHHASPVPPPVEDPNDDFAALGGWVVIPMQAADGSQENLKLEEVPDALRRGSRLKCTSGAARIERRDSPQEQRRIDQDAIDSEYLSYGWKLHADRCLYEAPKAASK